MPLRRIPLLRRAVDDASVEGGFFASGRPVPPPTDGHVRVVSWNIALALGWKLRGVDALLQGSSNLRLADVLALQEISRTRRINQARTLASRLGMNYVYAGAHLCNFGRERGQAILTPHPVLRSWRVALPQVRHPRIALAADLLIGEEVVRVVNVHLENRTRINPFIIRRRAEQLTHLLEWLESAGHARTLLVGDLNTLGFVIDRGRSEVLAAMLEAAGFTDAHRGGRNVTHRPLRTRLDWIFTRHATPVRGAVEDTGRVSDHFAVWADVDLHLSGKRTP
jgi:endonuclease/exonuclease/phosphatase family metal-dependent hydrolase